MCCQFVSEIALNIIFVSICIWIFIGNIFSKRWRLLVLWIFSFNGFHIIINSFNCISWLAGITQIVFSFICLILIWGLNLVYWHCVRNFIQNFVIIIIIRLINSFSACFGRSSQLDVECICSCRYTAYWHFRQFRITII